MKTKLHFIILILLFALSANCFAQNHYTKAKPILAEKSAAIKGRSDCFRLSATQNYDSVLLGCWFWPHNAPQSITFNKDHTFAIGDCGTEANELSNKGVYTLKGADGLLVFNDGQKEQFHIVLQKLKEKINAANANNQFETVDWRYMLSWEIEPGYPNYLIP